jgi:beta-glucanase (GH16 family)
MNFVGTRILAGLFSLCCLAACLLPERWTRGATPIKKQLVWSDEFDYQGLPDSARWSYDAGDGCPEVCGWGNNEQQYYTVRRLENARVEGGCLVIEARKEPTGTKPYSSARIHSRHKGAWKYGRIEASAKLPVGRGVWPAIWMLPRDWAYGNWPRSGEIDIMEHVGYDPDTLVGTVHTERYNHLKGTQVGRSIYNNSLSSRFHTYAVEWTPDKIDFYFDHQMYLSFPRKAEEGVDAWPFDQPFYLIMNVAVGGNWGGKKGIDPAVWPQQMLVDYVRVYQFIQ